MNATDEAAAALLHLKQRNNTGGVLGYGHSVVPRKRKQSAAHEGRARPLTASTTTSITATTSTLMPTTSAKPPTTTSTSTPTADPNAISCICTYTHDDGFSIACDACGRWCHMACFDIVPGGRIPETWFCWVCDRGLVVDRGRAEGIQRAWGEARAGAGGGAGRRGSPGIGRRGGGGGGGRKRRGSTALGPPVATNSNSLSTSHQPGTPQTPLHPPSSLHPQHFQPPPPPMHTHTLYPLSSSSPPIDILEESQTLYNHITTDIVPSPSTQTLLQKYAQNWRGISAISASPPTTTTPTPITLHPTPTPPTLPPSYTLHTTHPTPPHTLLTPYPSLITPSSDYLRDPLNGYAHLGMPKPFVSLLGPPLDLALDARMSGGVGRWVRRGCWPNAVLRPVVCRREKDANIKDTTPSTTLSFALFALRDLKAGEEIVLGWEWDDNHAVHWLPAVLETPGMFPDVNSRMKSSHSSATPTPPPPPPRKATANGAPQSHPHPHTPQHSPTHPPPPLTHLRNQMRNVLHALSSTFTTCACGNETRACALVRMKEFVEAGDALCGDSLRDARCGDVRGDKGMQGEKVEEEEEEEECGYPRSRRKRMKRAHSEHSRARGRGGVSSGDIEVDIDVDVDVDVEIESPPPPHHRPPHHSTPAPTNIPAPAELHFSRGIFQKPDFMVEHGERVRVRERGWDLAKARRERENKREDDDDEEEVCRGRGREKTKGKGKGKAKGKGNRRKRRGSVSESEKDSSLVAVIPPPPTTATATATADEDEDEDEDEDIEMDMEVSNPNDNSSSSLPHLTTSSSSDPIDITNTTTSSDPTDSSSSYVPATTSSSPPKTKVKKEKEERVSSRSRSQAHRTTTTTSSSGRSGSGSADSPSSPSSFSPLLLLSSDDLPIASSLNRHHRPNTQPRPPRAPPPSTVNLGPLVGSQRGFKTRERVPFSGGLGGVEMDVPVVGDGDGDGDGDETVDEEEEELEGGGEVRVRMGLLGRKVNGEARGKKGKGKEREKEREKERVREESEKETATRKERAEEWLVDEDGVVDKAAPHRKKRTRKIRIVSPSPPPPPPSHSVAPLEMDMDPKSRLRKKWKAEASAPPPAPPPPPTVSPLSSFANLSILSPVVALGPSSNPQRDESTPPRQPPNVSIHIEPPSSPGMGEEVKALSGEGEGLMETGIGDEAVDSIASTPVFRLSPGPAALVIPSAPPPTLSSPSPTPTTAPLPASPSSPTLTFSPAESPMIPSQPATTLDPPVRKKTIKEYAAERKRMREEAAKREAEEAKVVREALETKKEVSEKPLEETSPMVVDEQGTSPVATQETPTVDEQGTTPMAAQETAPSVVAAPGTEVAIAPNATALDVAETSGKDALAVDARTTDIEMADMPDCVTMATKPNDIVCPSPLVSSTLHNSKIVRSPSPAAPLRQEKICVDTTREAKVELLDHPIPDEVVSKKEEHTTAIPPVLPPPPVSPPRSQDTHPYTRHPPSSQEDGEIRPPVKRVSPPQIFNQRITRISPPTQPRSFNSALPARQHFSPSESRTKKPLPAHLPARPTPTGPRALRNLEHNHSSHASSMMPSSSSNPQSPYARHHSYERDSREWEWDHRDRRWTRLGGWSQGR